MAADPSCRYQVKGLARSRTFHIDSFSDPETAVDAAGTVAGEGEYARVLVVDSETWHGAVVTGSVGIVWDSDEVAP